MWVYICRDEIQRIKAENPNISHREAFSAAAKNVRSFLRLLNNYINMFLINILFKHSINVFLELIRYLKLKILDNKSQPKT